MTMVWHRGSGCASYNLNIENGRANLKLDFQLGSPLDPHITLHHHSNRRKKGAKRQERDRLRAAAHQARLGAAPGASSGGPPTSPGRPAASAAALEEATPHSPIIPADSAVADPPHVLEPAGAAADPPPPPLTTQAAAPVARVDLVSAQQGPSLLPAPEIRVSPAPPSDQRQTGDEAFVIVHATAVLENCPHEQLLQDDLIHLRKLFSSDNHLRNNIAQVELKHLSSRRFRSNLFTHTVSVLLSVKTSGLWDSPRQYIWKHLGQNDYIKTNGTKMKLTRIHVK